MYFHSYFPVFAAKLQYIKVYLCLITNHFSDSGPAKVLPWVYVCVCAQLVLNKITFNVGIWRAGSS